MFFPQKNPMKKRLTVLAFDVDPASLASLRKGLPGWKVEELNGATATSLAGDWDPGAADLFVVGFRGNGTDTLGLCRFLAFCAGYSKESRQKTEEALLMSPTGQNQGKGADASVLVLVPPGQENFIEAALTAGAHSCLMLPIHAQDVASMLVHAQTGNQPGRHTLNLEQAQNEDRWRDDGGQG